MTCLQLSARLLLALLLPACAVAQDSAESVRAKQDVLDLTDQRSFYLNADAVYPTASTIKIAVLAELYRQDERAVAGGSGAKLDDVYVVDAKDAVGGEGVVQTLTTGVTRLTNRDLAALVVTLSDNTATNVLIDRVGMDAVNAWLAGLGLKHTRLRRHMMDVSAAREGRENTATPRELVSLLKAIHDGRALRQSSAEELLKMLGARKESYLPRLLPPDLVIANKPGNLDGVRNDAGIVWVPARPFAIAVMTTFSRDDLAAETSIARIAHAAWSYFDRIGSSSPLGRVVR